MFECSHFSSGESSNCQISLRKIQDASSEHKNLHKGMSNNLESGKCCPRDDFWEIWCSLVFPCQANPSSLHHPPRRSRFLHALKNTLNFGEEWFTLEVCPNDADAKKQTPYQWHDWISALGLSQLLRIRSHDIGKLLHLVQLSMLYCNVKQGCAQPTIFCLPLLVLRICPCILSVHCQCGCNWHAHDSGARTAKPTFSKIIPNPSQIM